VLTVALPFKFFIFYLEEFFVNGFFSYDFELIIVSSIYVTYIVSKFDRFSRSFTAKFYYVMCKLDYLLFTKKKVIENNITFFINFYSSFLDTRVPEMGKKLDSGDSAFHNDHDVEKANMPEKQSLQAETIFSPSIPDAAADVDPYWAALTSIYSYVT